jgi:hypothetical protein
MGIAYYTVTEETKMVKVICINKNRNYKTNKIISYVIKDKNGNEKTVASDKLKTAIKTGVVDCINLTLTSDGRLIDKQIKTTNKKVYYRYVIYDNYNKETLGGLFRGIKKVLDILDEEGSYEDYEDINTLESKLEYILQYPNISNADNIVFYYTETGNTKAEQTINEMNDILSDHNIIIKKFELRNPTNIVYTDKDQIAILNK